MSCWISARRLEKISRTEYRANKGYTTPCTAGRTRSALMSSGNSFDNCASYEHGSTAQRTVKSTPIDRPSIDWNGAAPVALALSIGRYTWSRVEYRRT